MITNSVSRRQLSMMTAAFTLVSFLMDAAIQLRINAFAGLMEPAMVSTSLKLYGENTGRFYTCVINNLLQRSHHTSSSCSAFYVLYRHRSGMSLFWPHYDQCSRRGVRRDGDAVSLARVRQYYAAAILRPCMVGGGPGPSPNP